MIRLAVTGSSGYLGQEVVRVLEVDPEVERVLGLDVVPGPESEKTRFVRVDVRDPQLGRLLKEEKVNGIVHLAFIIEAARDPVRAREINVGGTANVLHAAAEAGVDRFVMMSSVAVYGAWPDNPVPLTEDLPPRPNPDDPYGQHKLQAEWLCRNFAEAHPEVAVAIMRPCGISGPRFTSPFLSTMQRAPFLPLPKGGRGLAQFIHERDAARLAVLLAKRRARGIFNGAGKGTLPWRAMYERLGKPIVTLPQRLLDGVLRLLWRLRLMPVLPVQMAMIAYPMIISGERAKRELGFEPQYTTRAALEATFASMKPPKRRVGRLRWMGLGRAKLGAQRKEP